jgi:hypothetical protein
MFKKQAGSGSGTGSKSKINAEAGSESEENNFGSMTLPETVVQENF